VPEGRYTELAALEGGRLIYLEEPLDGHRGRGGAEDGGGRGRGILRLYDLGERRSEVLGDRVDGLSLSLDRKALAYRSGRRLRVVPAGAKLDDARSEEGPGRRSGWVDLGRPRVEVDLKAEWRQMQRDAWRQMRDFFWTGDMGGVDWNGVYARYAALVDRVATRTELSDLLWEMQGEIGTSHAYEMSEPPEGRAYGLGSLAAEYAWDPAQGGYRVTHVIRGATWSENEDSPLRRPGAQVGPGEAIVAVNGRALDMVRTPAAALVGLGGEDVALALTGPGGARTVTVQALHGDGPARYREWVEHCRAYVHDASGGRVGYVHVPDMMTAGYAEFHRGYLSECERDALLLDVRYNRGGAVSWLLMDKLRGQVISYRLFRSGAAQAFPVGSVRGPMACLTNAYAGSDGDAVCQEFKLYRLGPVVGTRTWGGTIAISGERRLVDGTAVTQPEMRRWFGGAGWTVENHGVDPDIPVEERPEDAARGRDRQLERAVAELLRRLEANPPALPPDPADAPSVAPPPWPGV
jgi:tricorn protease